MTLAYTPWQANAALGLAVLRRTGSFSVSTFLPELGS